MPQQRAAKLNVRHALDPELLHRLEVDAVAAFIAGGIGVVGTLVVYESRRYCEGRGSLVCGACVGLNTECQVCHAAGKIKCVNCEATGLSIPPQLERKDAKTVDDELETKLDQIGIAAIADDLLRQEARPGDTERLNAMLTRRAESIAKRARSRSLNRMPADANH